MSEYRCYSCGETKDEDEFSKDSFRSTGRASKCRKCKHEYMRVLRQTPPYKIIQNQKRRIRTICKNKGYDKTTEFNNIFGTDVNGFKLYMENLFLEGMTWDNYGTWEVDHIIPLESINSFDDLVKLSYHKNLQPLWENDHKTKTKLYRTK
jgi:hypothetical protein